MRRNPSGAIHPTVFLLAWGALGIGLQYFGSVPFLEGLGEGARDLAAAIFLIPGMVLVIWGGVELWRNATPSDHSKPTTTLVTTGPFRLSRNPMYIGLLALMVGLGVGYGNLWWLVLAVPAALAMRRWTVRPEESYLEAHFEDEYRRYRQRVRRWL